MKYRQFGKTDLVVSEIGFGAWAIGGSAMVGAIPIGWGPADDDLSVKTIHASLDAGINFFDTADFYGLGHSEELLGKTLAKNKEVIIASKVGQRKDIDKVVGDYSYDYLIKACEASLKRLKRDHIDYMQLHTAKLQHLEEGECIRAMEELKRQGKIRHWGISVSTFNPFPEADYFIDNKTGEGLQLVFNLINQLAIPVIDKAAGAGMGVIARMPLQFGLLTGKFESSVSFQKDDHRSFRLNAEIIEKSNELIRKYWKPLAEEREQTMTEFALSFILSKKGVSTVIPGLRTPEQVKMNTKNIQVLGEDVMERLTEGSKEIDELIGLMRERG
jgi:aryl-alcohol dehydrogenase-like predicted oxidoreductase